MYFIYAILIADAWFLICNFQTFGDRTRIIDACQSIEDLISYDSVGYFKHLIRRITFRDPLNIYPNNIQLLMRVTA